MSFLNYFVLGLALAVPGMSCPKHETRDLGMKQRRAETSVEFSYELSHDWGRLSSDFATCQNGTQQAPIGLSTSGGMSTQHVPTFNYPANTTGTFTNWGFGPSFTLADAESVTANPSMTFDNETVFLTGWHIHAPADHTVDGVRSRAELHMVHVDAAGKERAVIAMRIDPPGGAGSIGGLNNGSIRQRADGGGAGCEKRVAAAAATEDAFLAQLPPFIGYNATVAATQETSLDLRPAVEGVGSFASGQFWTYEGSLTSPPCTEGIRFFVAGPVLTASDEQLQALLGASKYSARAEQPVWLHRVNQ